MSFLSAGADPFVKHQVMTDHRDLGENLGSVADECGSFDRLGDHTVFDQVRLARRKHERSIGNIDLSTPKRHRIEPPLDRPDDLLGIGFSGQHERVGHTR